MTAKISLTHADNYPYDAPDEWWASEGKTIALPPPAIDWAHRAARGIIADLKGRHTIKHGLENIDEETRAEIVRSLAEIIRLAEMEAK